MYDIIPQLIFILSLAGIVVILARRLPRAIAVSREPSFLVPRTLFFERFFNRIHPSSFKPFIFRTLEKFLRRFVILSLKAGNIASRGVEEVRERSKHIRPLFIEELIKKQEEKLLSRRENEYIEAIKVNPQDTEAYRSLGDLYMRRERLADARLSFEHILKINPGDGDAQVKLREIDKKLNMSA